MMGSYQVVILKEAQQLRGIERLSLYTQKPSPTTILVICHKEKNVDKRSAFYKGCAANGAVLESVRPRDYEIASWLQQFIRERGLTIDAKALSMLTDHLGTDIAKISNELHKLTVSLPEGTTRITDADIEANIGISKDFNNFELCKAVATRDMARALMIADHFARNPKDNPLLLTIMALFGQFRDLFVVNYLGWLSRRKGAPSPRTRSSCGSCARTTRSCSGRSSRTRPAGTTARYSTSWDCCANTTPRARGSTRAERRTVSCCANCC